MSNEHENCCNEAPSKCAGSAEASECPIGQAADMWEGAFCSAMTEAMSHRLRERIEKNWGAMLDSEADDAIEAIAAGWQVKVSQVKAKMAQDSFKESIVKNWLSANS